MNYEPRLPLLLERDLILFAAWDALTRGTALADEGVLRFNKHAGHKITLRIYGKIATSDLTGKPIIEDLKVMLGENDIADALPDSLLREFTEQALEAA